MKTRRLPGTDLELSVVGMGCWTIGGEWWGEVRDEDSIAAVRAAYERGVNWFDTAPLYGRGRADAVLARALGPRLKEVVVATKVGVRIDGEHAESDLSPAHVIADAEASLRRLGLERIDLLQVHWPCERGAPLEETLGALVQLQDQGKVRHFGLCNYSPEGLRAAAAALPAGRRLASLQTPYSLLRREFEQGLRGACAELEIGALAYEALCRGLLSGRWRSPPRFPETDLRSRDPRFQGAYFGYARGLTDDLKRAAGKLGVPVSALALGWVASRPGITAVIAGARSAEQVRQNVRAAALVDRPNIWKVIGGLAAAHGPPP
jgi:aryl-alcohol dehydrogenase-like predicted oxidoreductase